MMILAALTTAFALSGLFSWLLAHTRGGWQVLDMPNKRSLHTRPTPRLGGIAILLGGSAGLLVIWLLQGYTVAGWPVFMAALVLALVSLADDRHTLSAGLRLLVQVAVAAFLLFHYREPDPGILLLLGALLFLTWMINLYNFMDGMDGFAAGMSVFGFATFAILGWQAGQMETALGYALVAAACAGFLLLNFPPASLFMGDVGSTVLGLLAGLAILQSHRAGLLPAWLGMLVFSPFIVDATVTLVLRMLRREQFWKPHKTHFYQRLVQNRWGHRRTVLAEYTLMLACCGSALGGAALPLSGQVVLIVAWVLMYAVIIWLVNHGTAQHLADT
jgi:UDP-N-acetylmuramyl pentapeptide phosphotransferase/UDP-N-acetylglucosamine-1-phosphate transferase